MDTIVPNNVTLFDIAEAEMVKMEPVQMPLTHGFSPGLYKRKIFMPKGTLVSTRIHKTRHPFFILQGKVQIIEPDKTYEVEAPFDDYTEPDTQRLIYVLEDCVWVTCHATDLTDPDEIAEEITYHDNPLLDKEDPRLKAYKAEPALA